MEQTLYNHFCNMAACSNLNNILISAQGGAGKTVSLLHLASKLCTSPVYIGNNSNKSRQTIVPIYISCAEIFDGVDTSYSNSFIRQYIWRTLGSRENFDVEALEKRVFNSNDCPYLFVLLLDAINESAFQKEIEQEIESLSSYRNIRMIVTCRYVDDLHLKTLTSWTRLSYAPYEISRVKELIKLYNKQENLTDKQLEILTIPFYLKLYIDQSNQLKTRMWGETRASLLQVYLDDKIERISQSYQRDVSKLLTYYLPRLAFNIDLNRKMIFDKKQVQNCKFDSEFDLDEVIDVFLKTGIIVKLGNDSFKFSHEIYVDFLAAYWIKECVVSGREISPKYECIKSETLAFLAQLIFKQNRFCDTKGFINEPNYVTWMKSFGIGERYHNSGEDFSAELYNISFVLANVIDGIKNSQIEQKHNVSATISDILRKVYSGFKICNIRMSSKGGKNMLRLLAECLRRSGEFDASTQVSEDLIQLCDQEDRFYLEARHNIAKIKLYRAHDIATVAFENKLVMDECALKLFFDGISDLEELSHSHFAPSSNLYASLLSNPDLISEPYTNEYFREKTATERKYDAFIVNLETTKWEISPDREERDINYYSLQQCVSAISHGDVDLSGIEIDLAFPLFRNLHYLINFLYENKDKISQTREGSNSISKETIKIGQLLNEALFETYLSEGMCNSFDVLIGLMSEGEDAFLDMYQQNKRARAPVVRFLYMLICLCKNKPVDENELLDGIQKHLDSNLSKHVIDAFDAKYVLEDLQSVWRIYQTKYSFDDSLVNKIKKILKLEEQYELPV